MFHIQKKLRALLSFLFLISVSTFSTAQTGTFDVRMVIDSIDCANSKLFIDLQVRADNPGQEYFLGDQNYRFSFNRNVLANPALVQELDVTGFIPGGPGTLGFSFYSPHSLTGSLDTIVSYNLELSGGDGIFVTDTDYINVGRMSLDILDFNTPISMRWHRDIPTDFPKTFVGQNYNGDLIPTFEGSYLDYYQDLSSACSNTPPVAVNDTDTTPEEQAITVCVPTNDSDPENTLDPTSVTLVSTPPAAEGTVTVDAVTGCITFTPATDFNGTVTPFDYQICDLGTLVPAYQGDQNPNPIPAPDQPVPPLQTQPPSCVTATVNLTVTPVNDAPLATDDAETTPEDTPLNSDVLSNDNDPDGDALTLSTTPVTQPLNGTVMLNPNGTYTYTPNPNFNGTDSFEYTVCDGGTPNLCDTAVVNISITSVNDAPIAVDDTETTAEDTPLNADVLPNDSDPDTGDVLTVNTMPVVAPTNGNLILNADGTYTYTPNADFNGTDSFEYTVCDNGSPISCDNAVVNITITPANDAPLAVDDTASTAEDTPLNADVLTNDSDPDTGDVLTVNTTPVAGPTNGNLILNANGTYTYTPNPDFFGTDSFEYEVCDNGSPSLCDEAVVNITITSVNDMPIAVDDTASTTEDTPLNADVLPNDSDPDTGDALTVDTTPLVAPANGTLSLNSNGTYTYLPDTDFNGTDSFEYEVCDNGSPSLCDQAVVNITITPANDAPIAANDTETTAEDTPLNANVLTNDTDPDTGDVLTVNTTPIAAPTNGNLTLNANGTYTYTPNPDFFGADSFEYTVCDNGSPSLCDQAVVSITITSVNDAPVAVDDTETTAEDTPLNADVSLNDSDVDLADNLAVNTTPVAGPANGTLTLNANGTYTYTPNADFNGTDSFEYQICDDGSPLLCDNAMVNITITPANDAPVAVDDSETTAEDTPVTADVLPNDSDIDTGDVLTVNTTPTAAPTNGAVTLSANGTYTYTPNADFNGSDSFRYEVCDNGSPSLCDEATVTITVTPVNDTPVAVDDFGTTPEDIPFNGSTVLSNDTDVDTGDVLSVITTLTTLPANGTVTMNANGTFVYTPNSGFNGSDTFEYEVCDDGNPVLCDVGMVTITIDNVNDQPTALDDSGTTPEDTPLSGASVLANDTDIDGNNLTITTTPVVAPTSGMVTINANGTYVYTPDTDFNGTDSFQYEVCDDGLNPAMLCDTATVTITITSVNDAPIAVDDSGTTTEDTPLNGTTVLTNDSDVDTGDVLTANTTPTVVPANGTVVINANGTYVYTPNANFNGSDSFQYDVCDNGTPILCATATVNITVTAVNDAPVADDDTETTPEDTALTADVTPNDSDADGDPLTVNTTPVALPANGTVALNPNGTYTYTPNADFNGTDSFEYQICDNGSPALCDNAVVNITITPVNDAPVAVDDSETTSENTPVSADVSLNDNDVDGDPLSVNTTPIVAPTNGTLNLNANGTYTYTPNPAYSGLDNFEYQICDNGTPALCDNATVTISIGAVNDPPVAVDDTATTPEDTPLSGTTVLANDTDIDTGDILTVNTTPVAGTTNGILILNADGTYTYTPNPEFFGTDSFEYQVCDNGTPVLCDNAMMNITVTSVNDAPVAEDDTASTLENMPVTADVSPNDSDVETPALTYAVVSGMSTSNGTLVFNSNGTYTYTPMTNFFGTDTFTYEACDGGSPVLCDQATVTIIVGAVNNPPIAKNDVGITQEDTPLNSTVAVNDSEPEGDNMIYNTTPLSAPANGTLVLNNDGTYTYTPNPDFFGLDNFEYEVCDDGMPVMCATAIVTLRVNSVNDAPDAVNDQATTDELAPVDIDVVTNDSDVEDGAIDPCNVTIATPPTGGTISFGPAPACILTYTPNSGFYGTDAFEYEVCDNNGVCSNAVVDITVNPVCIDVQLAVWLEGGLADIGNNAYLPQMRNTLETPRQILPGQVNNPTAGQPYDVAPWSYFGTEGASWTDADYQNFKAAHGGTGIVDWILVSFRSGMAANTTFKKAAALVMQDGTVAFLAPCVLTISDPTSIYIVIEHYNHIGVMSDGPVAVNGGQVNYDFRIQDSFTNNNLSFGQKQIAAGIYAMYAGDCIQTADIGGYDINGGDKATWLLENGIFGNYLLTDINLDGDVNGADKILWFLNNGISSGVPR